MEAAVDPETEHEASGERAMDPGELAAALRDPAIARKCARNPELADALEKAARQCAEAPGLNAFLAALRGYDADVFVHEQPGRSRVAVVLERAEDIEGIGRAFVEAAAVSPLLPFELLLHLRSDFGKAQPGAALGPTFERVPYPADR
jgi:hypothetical protein